VCRDAQGQNYRCGQCAAAALANHIAGGTVSCRALDKDRYGRTVAICYLGSEDLEAWLVSEGWAFAYRRYGLDYVRQEDAARAAKRGLWAGSFIWPWDWRREH